MKRVMAMLLSTAVVLAFCAGTPAWAREMKGKVKSYETTTTIVTLDDGSQYPIK